MFLRLAIAREPPVAKAAKLQTSRLNHKGYDVARGKRLFAGQKLRALRRDGRLDQASMARLLGISVPYLSQLENDERPLTATVKASLARAFPLDWSTLDHAEEEQLLAAFNRALADPGYSSPTPDPERIERLHLQYPEFAARHVDLHHRLRRTEMRLAMAEDAIGVTSVQTARLPWEHVRDWLHARGNYLHDLDVAAEELAKAIGIDGIDNEARLAAALSERHGWTVEAHAGPAIARPALLQMLLNASLPAPSQAFLMARQFMMLEAHERIDAILLEAVFVDPIATDMLRIALANYAAGALVMPYAAFRAEARLVRHDVDLLASRFAASIEQVCHRLSTLQRPGLRGLPVFFCRIDMAGNITKRHSLTRLQFARFGGTCPLWVVHEAAAVAGRSLVQLGEMPDGLRYVTMARGVTRPGAPNHAIVLGCEADHAAAFIYADGLPIADEAGATPIGSSCRLCPREGCNARAYPPLDRPYHIDPALGRIVPFTG